MATEEEVEKKAQALYQEYTKGTRGQWSQTLEATKKIWRKEARLKLEKPVRKKTPYVPEPDRNDPLR